MQVVAEWANELGYIKLMQCEEADSADHLHFEFKISYKGYSEELVGHLPVSHLESMESIALRITEMYAANAKKLWHQANDSAELTIH